MIVITVFGMSPPFQWYLSPHLLTSDLAAVSRFHLTLARLFLQCIVNTVVTPHSHVLNLTSVRTSAPRVCINFTPTEGALEQTPVGLLCASTAEMNFWLRRRINYHDNDDVHRRLQDLSLSVVPAPFPPDAVRGAPLSVVAVVRSNAADPFLCSPQAARIPAVSRTTQPPPPTPGNT